MAFKSITEYNNERYSGMFLLKNDGDSADVIFMYKSIQDVLMCDTHYIKSENHSGYVQCLGSRSCPACERNIRVQPKLFIPLYVIESNTILFWDRSIRFQQQLENDVFSKFPNPSEFVFRITRHGAAGDINTRYSIQAIGKNNVLDYEGILSKLDVEFPEYYNSICKDWTSQDYNEHLSATSSNASVDVDSMPEYKLSPRKLTQVSEMPDILESSLESDIASEDKVDF